jgi:DNA helicase IV
MAPHPDLAAEQAHVALAYERVVATRAAAERALRAALAQGGVGTPQALVERDVMVANALERIERLAVGDEAICFGRIDRDDGESFHIGRFAVADVDHTPLVIDWRVPAAEPFYRATGRHPMGLWRRRHLVTDGRRVIDLEDELFGDVEGADANGRLSGPTTLLAALERSRTGHMRDIVATVQGEQDQIIRAPLAGVLVVEGGPGTGKTAVALHRAAYLLYTHRFPLERQGVLVVGPNRLFLRYIEQVLPSLGETGVTLATPASLVPEVTVTGDEPIDVARLKGDARMAPVIAKAVRDRERPLRRDLSVPFGRAVLRLAATETAEIVAIARRRTGPHNPRRRLVERLLFERLHDRWLQVDGDDSSTVDDVRDALRRKPAVVEALERMWPVLTPVQLLHDLFGAPALIDLAAPALRPDERRALYRPRHALDSVAWTPADVALLDEAREQLGPVRGREELRTYGHIVVDEAQDLSAMELRMLARRSLSGSMTVVGDLAQATGASAPAGWDELVRHLRPRRGWRLVGLTVNYRTPSEIMLLADRVLAVAVPGATGPRSVRDTGVAPQLVRCEPSDLAAHVARLASAPRSTGTVAIVCAPSMREPLAAALQGAGLDFGDARHRGLAAPVTLVDVGLVKGLEFDEVIVVSPARLVAEAAQGLRSLYVALTRATRRLVVVHGEDLPPAMESWRREPATEPAAEPATEPAMESQPAP